MQARTGKVKSMETQYPPASSDGKARKLKRKVIYVYETEDGAKEQSLLATAGQTQMDYASKVKPPAISSDEYFNYNKKD